MYITIQQFLAERIYIVHQLFSKCLEDAFTEIFAGFFISRAS